MRLPSSLRHSVWAFPLCYLHNLLCVYVAFMLSRVAFVWLNKAAFASALTDIPYLDWLSGSLLFDTSAIHYLGLPVLLAFFLPCHVKENETYHRVTRGLYLFFFGAGLLANFADALYFPFTGRRTTASLFSEFSAENNLALVVAKEVAMHWYVVALFGLLLWALHRLYLMPPTVERRRSTLVGYYAVMVVSLAVAVGLSVAGIRGGFTRQTRPITLSNANQYVERPAEAAIVLNTPFSMIRSAGKNVFHTPAYFASQDEVAAHFSPLHPAEERYRQEEFAPYNVVVIIAESLGREYIGALNDLGQCGEGYHGYTPFLDSLCHHAFTTDFSFCNGRKSIDGMPSILSSIPMIVEPFVLTPASLNDVSGLAEALSTKGYSTAFFHGASNGSMGFEAYARSSGFASYYGRTEYDQDPDFGGEADFDGCWAIWDEPFLQFFAKQLTALPTPFMASVFTATSHHPYQIPEVYRDTFPDEGVAIHKCIRYLDHALRRFFARASQEEWFAHTLFVIAGDHTNLTDQSYYQTDLGYFGSPFIIYDPSALLVTPQRRHAVAQQIDFMPTVLSALGYDRPYFAYGCDLLTTPDSLTWAFNYNNGIYQYVAEGHLLQFDGETPRALYDLSSDWYLQHNLLHTSPAADSTAEHLLPPLKALIQDYMYRMENNLLTYPQAE